MLNLKKYILFISLIIFTSSKAQNSNYCQRIQCNSQLDDNTCIKVESTISLMNPCKETKICDIQIEDPILDSYCIEKDIFSFKKLPSLPCEDNEECLSKYCSLGECMGKSDGSQCNSPSECYYGKTCRKNLTLTDNNLSHCLDPLKEGENCEIDTDCEIDCGCMKGICTKYFSLENNEETGGIDYNSDFNFCKSGYVNELGFCMNITLKNDITECSDLSPCEYDYTDKNNEKKSIIIDSNCLCGYNPFGKQYCLLGSGNNNYTKYLDKLKKYHLNNKNCHLSERTANGCQKDIISNNKETLQQIKELINAKYWAKSNNRLIDAPECVFNIEFPDYDRSLDINQDPDPIQPGKCAKYLCKEVINEGTCAISNYKSDFDIEVTLADVCSDNIKCKLNGEPNEVFYNKTNIEAKCSSSILNKRYPGEKCEIDSECLYPLNNPSTQFHKCEDGYCNGMEENGICEDNTWCIVGYYCDVHEGKCKKQIKKGGKCLESKDCKNNLICKDGVCDELFTLDDGQSVPERESYEFKKRFCKNGEVINNKCVSFNDLDGTKVNDDDYKKCDFNSYCEYKINGLGDGKKKYVKCGCGYNSEGQGYCPHYHDYSKNDWEEYRDILKEKTDNKCHTESRYDCYEYDEENSDLSYYKNKLENGHLFYNCVECAKKVLNGNYLSTKKLACILLGLLIILI